MKRLSWIAALAGLYIMPSTASAYSVKVHIHLANEIRDEMIRNMDGVGCEVGRDEWCGKPAIKLLGPNEEPQFVLVDEADAQAIVDNPEFWRGGAIGPDNTVFPGMTDPSHAWHFAPFSQCQAMLENSEDGAERAYALGCFLHGITDNNVHHVVNYFSGETFTLFPKDAAEDGELKFSLINVVRHMTVEGKIEKALAAARPEAFAPELLKHRIAADLYRRVYLDTSEGRGLWHWFAGSLVERKNDALRAAQLDGFDPNDHLELSIEEIREQGKTIDLDGRVIDAYIEFLESGGTVDGLAPAGLAPHDYVLLLPEIIEDIKRLLDIAEANGVEKMNATVSEWQADGECSLTCPLLRTRKELYEHLYAPREDRRSRFGEAVDLKKEELDEVLDGYILTVERLSNVIVAKGVGGIGPSDLADAMQPLTDAVDQVTDFPYEALFPEWAVDVIQNVAPLRDFLERSFALMTEEVKRQVLARMTAYTEQLREQLLALAPQAVQDIVAQVGELRDIALEQLDAAKLDALGIDLSDADSALASFETSVLYMNSYNSIAGALANQELVFSQAPTSFFGGGPVSFDASYQVGYNQMSACSDFASAFYPCGTSSIESLQGDYNNCERLDVTAEMEPHVECHDGKATEWVDDANPAQCVARELEEIIDFDEGHLGSYTLAYPPALANRGPECFGATVPGLVINIDDRPEDNAGDGDADGDDAGEGCGCSTTTPASGSSPWLLLVAGLWLKRRRRR